MHTHPALPRWQRLATFALLALALCGAPAHADTLEGVLERGARHSVLWFASPESGDLIGQVFTNTSQAGQVILAWDEARDGARIPDDAFNVVLHEFAHQLDAESGLTNGAPDLGSAQRHARWAEVMQAAYAELKVQGERGEETVMDLYGTTNPVEFFAVSTEAFFERGPDLHRTQPELYAVLKGFYQVDPAAW